MRSSRHAEGFSLIEMIAVLVLMGIVGAAFAVFLNPAVRAYAAQTQRAALVDAAESALRRMAREIRIALPNSVRISSVGTTFFAIEILPTVDGGRYCALNLADCAGAVQILDFSLADAAFDILGCFQDAGFIAASGTNAYRLVIGDSSGLAYSNTASPGVITPAARTISLSVSPPGTCGSGTSRHHIVLSAGHQFSAQSPRERLFVMQASAVPVSYICDTAAKTLKRYAGYGLPQASQPTNPAIAPLSTAPSIALVANNVSSCSVASTTSTVQNSGIVILTLGLTNSGETVSLMHQAQLDNSQ